MRSEKIECIKITTKNQPIVLDDYTRDEYLNAIGNLSVDKNGNSIGAKSEHLIEHFDNKYTETEFDEIMYALHCKTLVIEKKPKHYYRV